MNTANLKRHALRCDQRLRRRIGRGVRGSCLAGIGDPRCLLPYQLGNVELFRGIARRYEQVVRQAVNRARHVLAVGDAKALHGRCDSMSTLTD